MSDYPMLISNKLHSFRNFLVQNYENLLIYTTVRQGGVEIWGGADSWGKV